MWSLRGRGGEGDRVEGKKGRERGMGSGYGMGDGGREIREGGEGEGVEEAGRGERG